MKRLQSKYIPIVLLFLVGGLLSACKKDSPHVKIRHTIEEVLAQMENGERTLPVLFVQTHKGKGIHDNESWYKGTATLLTTSATFQMEDVPIEYKGRGHASWNFPKKGFDIRFSDDRPFLDMPSGSRWCCLANWRDRTIMRNAVSLEIARLTSLDWTPEGRYVEIYVDGLFEGNYYVTQKVMADEGHVQVGQRGYLVLMDDYFEKDFRFRSAQRSLPVNLLPREETTFDKRGFEDAKAYINSIEGALYKGAGDWRDYLDVESFCDWLIVHELTGNNEPTRPHSVYFHTSPGGELRAGPAWDFDCRTFRPGVKGLVDKDAVWFNALLSDRNFTSVLRQRWTLLRPVFEEQIPPFIDRTKAEIRQSALVNCEMWPISTALISPNGDEKLSFDDAVARLRDSFFERLSELDSVIQSL